MPRGTVSAALRALSQHPRQAAAEFLPALQNHRGRQTVSTDEGEMVLESWFEEVRVGTHRRFGGREEYDVVAGTFVHEFPITIETRDGFQTLPAIARGRFSIRPQQKQMLYLGRTGDADLFASQVALALLDDAHGWNFLNMTREELLEVRRRAVNVRSVGYRRNPDPYVHRMGYAGTTVDQNADVRRADRNAILYRVTITMALGSGRRTVQIMETGNMLGYGANAEDFEDLGDIIYDVLA